MKTNTNFDSFNSAFVGIEMAHTMILSQIQRLKMEIEEATQIGEMFPEESHVQTVTQARVAELNKNLEYYVFQARFNKENFRASLVWAESHKIYLVDQIKGSEHPYVDMSHLQGIIKTINELNEVLAY